MGRDLRWLFVVLAALGAGAPAARAADHPVSFPADPFPGAYSPSSVEAGVGDTVTFSGAFASHPLVWNAGDFPTQSGGTTNAYTFTRPGTFAFHCQLHATMTGVVHVAGNLTAAPDFTWTVSGARASFTATGSDPDGTIARFEWDLDGNGTFETTGTATPARTYAAGSTTTVRLRYVDDANETSPATAHVVTVGGTTTPSPPGGGGAGGGGTTPPPVGGGGTGSGAGGTGGGGGTTPATTSPNGGGQGDDDAGSPGVRVRSSSLAFAHGRARVAVTLTRSGAVRVRLVRAGTTLAAGAVSRLAAGERRVTVRLTRAGTRALRSGRRIRATLSVTLRARAGGAALTARRTVTLR